MPGKNIFVFVVCGADKHIDTLNFSLRCLKYFSKKTILVVTDLKRNSKQINHHEIIDISAPEKFTHHQASIYLKTRLHTCLDLSENYCYLDSDVIALNGEADKIFNYREGPVTFASDHCRIDQFSPYATNCGCLEKSIENKSKLHDLIKKYNPYSGKEELLNNMAARDFYRAIDAIKRNPISNIPLLAKFFFTVYLLPSKFRYFRINENIRYDKFKKLWIDNSDAPVLYHVLNYYKQIEKNSEFRFKLFRTTWVDKAGKNIYMPECDHLTEAIYNKFGISIPDKKWQHWNGGVFLFNKNSAAFMDTWHDFTMQIFEDKNWVVRDQGTLAATAWKHNLQNQKRLPVHYNFIADFYNPGNTFSKEKGFTPDNFKTIINPSFIHIYHEFGRKGWEIWDAVENISKLLLNQQIPEIDNRLY
ncbi:MAG: hypothetical protein HY958_09895 [Bacteroidia bacterium]|nr:hypothetical protein [Bacteroidia bacterium]